MNIERTSSESSFSDNESLPAPSFPAPRLYDEEIYGKIRKVVNSSSNPNVASVELRSHDNVDFNTSFGSDRATRGSLEGERSRYLFGNFIVFSVFNQSKFKFRSRIFSRQLSINSQVIRELEKYTKPADKSDSWAFFNLQADSVADSESLGSSEPIYANEEPECYYGRISEMKSNVLCPEKSPIPGPSAARRSD